MASHSALTRSRAWTARWPVRPSRRPSAVARTLCASPSPARAAPSTPCSTQSRWRFRLVRTTRSPLCSPTSSRGESGSCRTWSRSSSCAAARTACASHTARAATSAVLLLQPPRHDEKLHNAPATTATVAPAKAASHGKPPVAEAPTSRPASPAVSTNVSKTKVDKNALSARSGGAKRAASSSPTDEDAPPTLTKRAAKKPDYDAWQRHCLLLALEYGIDGPQVMDEALSGDGDEELREAHRDAYRLGDHAMDSDDDVYSDEDDPGDINTGWG